MYLAYIKMGDIVILTIHYVWMAFLATLVTWALTALGAATVFFVKKINNSIMAMMFGFGAGVMLAAAFLSLILPAMNLAGAMGQIVWLVIVLGFISGSLFILIVDLILPHLHTNHDEAEGLKSTFSQKALLVFAITLHNIPEGLAVGVAFGAAFLNIQGATMAAAWALAIGIGLQNIPEGMAVSLPLRNDGMNRKKSFFYGQISGLVEPISGVVGALLVTFIQGILPFTLCFAAGAMVYVIAEELIPSGKNSSTNKLGTIGVIFGFAIMMALDIGLA